MSEKESVKSLVAIKGLEAAAHLLAQAYAHTEGTQRLEAGIKIDAVISEMNRLTNEYLYPYSGKTMTF